MILIIMKIISFTLKQSGWKVNRKVKTKLKIVKPPIFSYRLEVLEIFNFIFHFSALFLSTDHYYNFTLTLRVILMAIGNTRHIFRRIIIPFLN